MSGKFYWKREEPVKNEVYRCDVCGSLGAPAQGHKCAACLSPSERDAGNKAARAHYESGDD